MEWIRTDVLVVGGGLTGLRAAIAAAEKGLSVLLVSKTAVATDNCTAAAAGHMSGAVGGTDEVEYLDRLSRMADGRAEERLQRILAFESGPAISELRRFGVLYHTARGHVVSSGPEMWAGIGYTEPLHRFAEEHGVAFRSPVCVSELCIESGECCGAVAMDLLTQETLAITAGATILCGGGFAGVFPRHDNPGRTSGDCIHLAARAGAALRDMEFVRFHALGLAEGDPPNDLVTFAPAMGCGQITLRDGTPVERADLPAIFERRSLDLSRDDEKFDAFLDLTDTDWHDEPLASVRRLLLADVPVDERPVRLSPLAHYTSGGIAIDQHGQTGVPYLFAAGECTGGVMGAGRPGGAALLDCVVFGRRAGAEAGRQAKRRDAPAPVAAAPIDLGGSDQPAPVLDKARWILWNYASVFPQREGLVRCAAELDALEGICAGLRAGPVEDWLALHELKCTLAIGKQLVNSLQT